MTEPTKRTVADEPTCNGPFGDEKECPVHGAEIRRARGREDVVLHATHAQMVQIHGHWNRLAAFATAQAPADEELWHTIEAIADIMFREWPVKR